jgi:hypothetical protein
LKHVILFFSLKVGLSNLQMGSFWELISIDFLRKDFFGSTIHTLCISLLKYVAMIVSIMNFMVRILNPTPLRNLNFVLYRYLHLNGFPTEFKFSLQFSLKFFNNVLVHSYSIKFKTFIYCIL